MSAREEVVLEALRSAGGPASAAVLARRSRIPVRTVKSALRRLEGEGRARRNGSGSWSPTG